MKPYFSFFVILFLLGLAESRIQEQQHYWKHVMGEEPMPDAIKDLLPITQSEGQDPVLRRGKDVKWGDLINRDFDSRSTAIIYHQHDGQMMPHHDDGVRPRDR
ncbi:hypothetical protein V2J09_002147 [Rumex salicifolius]